MLYSIKLTNYYIAKDTLRSQVFHNHKYGKNKVNMIKLWIEIHLEFILHSITLTDQHIVKDIFRSQVFTALQKWKKEYRIQNKNIGLKYTLNIYYIISHLSIIIF